MRVGVIINPISGRAGRARSAGGSRADLARRLLAESGADVEIAETARRGHAVDLARRFVADRVDMVVAWGGDGTVNEVAGPLVGTETVLAIVPSGSGDGLARGLGISRRPEYALRLAVNGPVGRIDVGFLGDRHFLNIAGVGFDAAVAARFNARRARGALGYVTGALAGVWAYRCADYRLEIDGHALLGQRLLIAFANGSQYGNGLTIAPDAVPWDGRLNVVAVDGGAAWRQFWRARRLFYRPLEPASGILRTTASSARIIADGALACHVDGETFTVTGPMTVRLEPGALKLRGLMSSGRAPERARATVEPFSPGFSPRETGDSELENALAVRGPG